jgi:hypothetical protein
MPICSSSFRSPFCAVGVRIFRRFSNFYLFIYKLFNHATYNSEYIASNGSVISEWLIQNNVEESGYDLILVLSRHFSRDLQEDNKRSDDSLSEDQVSNPVPLQ